MLNATLIEPLFVPAVGETLSQLAAGGVTVHFSTRLPEFETRTVCVETLDPTVADWLIDVGESESTDWADAVSGSRTKALNPKSERADRRRRVVFMCILTLILA